MATPAPGSILVQTQTVYFDPQARPLKLKFEEDAARREHERGVLGSEMRFSEARVVRHLDGETKLETAYASSSATYDVAVHTLAFTPVHPLTTPAQQPTTVEVRSFLPYSDPKQQDRPLVVQAMFYTSEIRATHVSRVDTEALASVNRVLGRLMQLDLHRRSPVPLGS